jgi:hypothetical protein
MVAIRLPQPDADAWSASPALAPVPHLRPAPTGERRPARTGPDRATRFRRRRLVALVATALTVVALIGAVDYLSGLTGPNGGPVPLDAGPAEAGPGLPAAAQGEAYVVQPGDTYWTIAATVAPDRDPRPVVDQLRDANGDGPLAAGDRLVLDIG